MYFLSSIFSTYEGFHVCSSVDKTQCLSRQLASLQPMGRAVRSDEMIVRERQSERGSERKIEREINTDRQTETEWKLR